MQLNEALSKIRAYPNTPQPGVTFRDITPLLADAAAFKTVIEHMANEVKNADLIPDVIVCPEARGFILGSALAYHLGIGMIIARKPGKLPGQTVTIDYQLEYGTDSLHISADTLYNGQKALLVDDVLATGGTISACAHLLSDQKVHIQGYIFLIELLALQGRQLLGNLPIISLIKY